MFTTFLKGITGFFERHFLIAAFFPVLLFVALNLGMVILAQGATALLNWWGEQSANYQTVLIVAVLSSVVALAYLFSIFQTVLTRLFEGYWHGIPKIGSWLVEQRRPYYKSVWQYLKTELECIDKTIKEIENTHFGTLHAELVALHKAHKEIETWLGQVPAQHKQWVPVAKQKMAQVEKEILEKVTALKSAQEEIAVETALGRVKRRQLEREFLLFFPPEQEMVLPTRLGNILRASEAYGLRRYGLDAVVVWPRLYGVLPDEAKKLLSYSKANLDLFLVLTVLMGIFALFWQVYAAFWLVNWVLFAVATVGWGMVVIFYQAALQAARVYGEVVKATFDLHRWALLKALHLKMPTTLSEERTIWKDVSQHFYRGYLYKKAVYETAKAKEPPKEEKIDTLLDKIIASLKKWRDGGGLQ